MMFKPIFSWRLLIGIVLVFGLGCVFFYLKKDAAPARTLVFGRVDMQAALKEHPNWDRYQELQGQIDKLHRKWNTKNAGSNNRDSATNSGSENIAELYQQVNEIEQNYMDESRLKLANLNNTIKDYVQNRTEQLNAVLKERLANINNQLNKELQNSVKSNEAKLQAYLNELQADNQVTLSNLQLQLSLLDVSGDQSKSKIEKDRIQNEILRIKNDIEKKRAAREEQLKDELQTYAENLKKQASKDLEQFKTESEKQAKDDILAYRQKLENEYLDWKTNREEKVNSAKKVRQEKLEQEYRQDGARETILKSQQEQLKEAIIWDIRQKAKRIASSQKIDCILADDYLNINVRDLTSAVKSSLPK